MSTPPRYPLSRLALGLALAAAFLATLPAVAVTLVPDGPLVEVGAIGPGYTRAQLAPLAAQQPRVVMDGAGNFFVFWWQADQSLAEPRLMSSKFDAAGEPMLQVSEFWDPVDGIGPIRGMDDVAISAAGDLVVAWHEPGGGIFLRGFDNCRLSLGPIIAVGDGEPADGHAVTAIERLAVGIADDRTIVVAWVQAVQAAGGGGFDEVVVERFGVGGSQLAPAIRVADHAEILGLDLEVAADGSFGVALEAVTGDPAARTVDLALFDAAGQPMAVPPLAGDHPSIGSPQVAASGIGTFLLAYAGSGGGACAGIFARAHGADGSPVGLEKRIDAPATGCQRRPAAAGMDDGWAVAWAGADADAASAADAAGYGIWVQPVGATGLVSDGAVRVLPGWAHFDLAARGQWTAVAAVLADGPKDVPRVVVRRLGPPEAAACAHGSTDDHLCLQGDRFRVDADWRDPYNTTVGLGSGFDVADVQDSGAFWFFHAANLELLVKVLDGRGVNGHWWVFSGALSTVEYWVTVTEVSSGRQRVYYNPPFVQASIADAAAFDAFPPEGEAASAAPQLLAGGAVAGGVLAVPAGELGGTARETAPLTPVPCGGGVSQLCLRDDLFGVFVEWTNPRTGVSGVGHAIPMTGDTGGFWFFDEDNVELMVKVLDGRRVNGHWWVFYAGLSDVEYTLTVHSAFSDPVTYTNPAFEVTSGADTAAVEAD